MKKCDYCAKEISYHEIYCSDKCQIDTNKFYDIKEKYSTPFSILNGILVLSIGIGIFMYSLLPTAGAFMVSFALLFLGILYFALPFPPDVFIRKYKLKKSIFISRIIAIVLFVLGIIALILTLIFVV